MNPYLTLALNVILTASAHLLLKRGADGGLLSPWTIAGIACFIASFLVWLQALRRLPLSVAFPLTSASHVLIPLGSWLLLGEAVPALRWGGIALITGGIACCTVPR